MIRKLGYDDAQDVYDLLRPFYDEGHWADVGKYSPENTISYIISFLTMEEEGVKAFGSFEGDELVGLAVVEICYEFHTRPMAYLSNFYTRPDVRGGNHARKLIERVVEVCDNNDCLKVYAANSGVLSNKMDNLFGNLVAKFGFIKCSSIHVRG